MVDCELHLILGQFGGRKTLVVVRHMSLKKKQNKFVIVIVKMYRERDFMVE